MARIGKPTKVHEIEPSEVDVTPDVDPREIEVDEPQRTPETPEPEKVPT